MWFAPALFVAVLEESVVSPPLSEVGRVLN